MVYVKWQGLWVKAVEDIEKSFVTYHHAALEDQFAQALFKRQQEAVRGRLKERHHTLKDLGCTVYNLVVVLVLFS